MSEKVAVTQSYLQDIADALREVTGGTETYKPSEMDDALRAAAGSGGSSVETCTGFIGADLPDATTITIYYTDANMQTVTATDIGCDTVFEESVAKGTILVTKGYAFSAGDADGLTLLYKTSTTCVWSVDGDYSLIW